MAEIIVEPSDRNRNKKPSIWPWILGALLLIGLIWVAVEALDDDEPEAVATTAVDREPVTNNTFEEGTSATVGNQDAVSAFIMFANQENENGQMSLDHAYTSEGIEKLGAALSTLANNTGVRNADVESTKARFEQIANQIQQDPQSLQHANLIKESFMEAANLMQSIENTSQTKSGANIEGVKQAAENIDMNTPTLEQRENVKAFFDKAGEAVEEMSTGVTNQ